MNENDTKMIDYLEACMSILGPWSKVMSKTEATHPDIGQLPEMDSVFFGFLAQIWLQKRKFGIERMPIADAARYVPGLSPSRASRFVSSAIDYGYLQKQDDLKDKRKKIVWLSPETEVRIDEAVGESMKAFEKVFA